MRRLTEHLESPSIGFRLFLRHRDLLGGAWVYETFAQLIESQCRRVIVILSPDFLLSPDCKFQAQFATGLAIEKRSRVLIPVIYKQCSIPSIIRLLTKIDMTSSSSLGSSTSSEQKIPEWSMNRLVRSIQDTSAGQNNSQPQIGYNFRPSITDFHSRPPSSTSSPIVELPSSSCSVTDLQSLPSPPQNDPWADDGDKRTAQMMSTTVSAISCLTIGDDDQKQLIRRSVDEDSNRSNDDKENAQQKNKNAQKTGASRSRELFESFKRKIKVKL